MFQQGAGVTGNRLSLLPVAVTSAVTKSSLKEARVYFSLHFQSVTDGSPGRR